MTTRNRNTPTGWALAVLLFALVIQAAPGAEFTFKLDGDDGQSWQNLWDSPANWTYVSGVDDGVAGIPDGADTFTIDRTSNVSNGTRLVTEGGALLEVAGFTGTGTGNQDIVLKHRDFTVGDVELLASANPFHIRSERDRSYSITGVISGPGDLLMSRDSGFSDGTQPDELITITGSSPNTITGSIRLWNSNNSADNPQPSYWVADKVGAFGQAPTLTLEGRAGANGGIASLQITANAVGDEGAIDDDATTVYIGAKGVLNMDAGVDEKIGVGKLFIDLAGTGTYTEVAEGTYDNSEDWIIGDGTVTVGVPAPGPRIASIIGVGGGVWELTLEGDPDTAYEFRSSTTLDFTPGTLVEPLAAGVPAVGTIGGDNDSQLTTDGDGNGTVRMTLAGPANYVVAKIPPPPPPLYSWDFEADNGGYSATGTPNDWAWGTPNSNNNAGLVLTTGNGGSTNCWATNLGDGSGPPSGMINTAANSILRSPDLDLTSVSGAQLAFAAAVDTQTGDTVEVLVREVGTDLLLDTILPVPSPSSADWDDFGPFDLSAADNKNVYLEFRVQGTDAAYIGLYLDDVEISLP